MDVGFVFWFCVIVKKLVLFLFLLVVDVDFVLDFFMGFFLKINNYVGGGVFGVDVFRIFFNSFLFGVVVVVLSLFRINYVNYMGVNYIYLKNVYGKLKLLEFEEELF